jgi:hypothetical protein
MLNVILIIVIFGTGYFFWVRPILARTPAFKDFYDREESFLAAVSAKLAGIKQKLAGALVVIAAAYVEIANYVAPALTGVDTSTITKNFPEWAVPLIPIALTILLNYFRDLADKRKE